jgi:hypothetical protein
LQPLLRLLRAKSQNSQPRKKEWDLGAKMSILFPRCMESLLTIHSNFDIDQVRWWKRPSRRRSLRHFFIQEA